jgi:hypothetical protein
MSLAGKEALQQTQFFGPENISEAAAIFLNIHTQQFVVGTEYAPFFPELSASSSVTATITFISDGEHSFVKLKFETSGLPKVVMFSFGSLEVLEHCYEVFSHLNFSSDLKLATVAQIFCDHGQRFPARNKCAITY